MKQQNWESGQGLLGYALFLGLFTLFVTVVVVVLITNTFPFVSPVVAGIAGFFVSQILLGIYNRVRD